ncbi:phosphate/phosphite/phosphonate ABC transporter substrate-binding protein [Hyphomonas atlantica corrig.]|uniref:phosphate/phosphite/phosphonate ABC transporter substrate-binding protein n=1 Tax=Hyphomonas atlantica TaxID=1280948 RepID=UPI00235347B0|nr:phosphate/phosphite/phosphonate ABC transporter substrate-binding protein [Hyphomonas atlantica]
MVRYRIRNKWGVVSMVEVAVRTGMVALMVASLMACSGKTTSSERQHADDWRAEMPLLKMGSSASEDEPIALQRIKVVQEYLTDALKVPVKIYQTSDYNGNIQAISSGQIHIATMGGGSYANVDAQIGDLAEAILVRRDTMGLSGYYSTIVVKADSSYQKIEDLKGKKLAYVDFNSTSGYIYPRWAMRNQGIEPETYFAEAAMAGGHIQSVMALSNGQFDATVVLANGGTPEIGFGNGTLKRLARRGMIDEEDYRVIWHAGPVPNSPYVARTDLPIELRDYIRGALAAMPYEAPQAHTGMARLPGNNYKAVNRDFYEDLIDMRLEEISTHRTRAIGGNK